MKIHSTIAAFCALTACIAGNLISTANAQRIEPVRDSVFATVSGPSQNAEEGAKDDGAACGKCDCSGKCDCGIGSYCDQRLLGLIRKTDRCYSDFISPMTNPVFFEDPRNLTEIRFIFIHQEIPSAVYGGGDAQLIAASIRASLTERLSLVAAKDGFIIADHPAVDDGWADVSVGLKYMLFADPCAQRIVSAGVTYELPIGSTRALQGNGDGEFHVYLTGGTQIGRNWHFLSGSGFRLPTDTVDESQVWYWSNHLDCKLTERFYVFGEVNWYHWLKSGEGPLVDIEGGDLFNLGSRGVAGNNMVTGALGVKFKPREMMELGLAWEAPIGNREDLMDNRLTFDCILRY